MIYKILFAGWMSGFTAYACLLSTSQERWGWAISSGCCSVGGLVAAWFKSRELTERRKA